METKFILVICPSEAEHNAVVGQSYARLAIGAIEIYESSYRLQCIVD
jgi:hypothetical protein